MSDLSLTQSVPLMRDGDGILRITGSRVTLDSIAHQFKSGATAEQIQEDFPSITLADIYSVIAYFLQHREAVESYLAQQTHRAEQARSEIEQKIDTTELRERLKQRRARAAA